jgi:phosphoglycerol transferase MdoB-like AlkP superfamily enzyme
LLPTLLVFLFAADASARDGEPAVPTTDGDFVASGAPEAPLKHRFTVVESENRRFMGSGGRSRLRVVIRNDGDLVWTPDRPLRLSSRWRRVGSKRWEWGNRTELPARVAPGATVEVAAKMRAPKISGVFIVQWDMVEKGVGWFSATDPTPAPEHMVVVLPLQTLPFWILLSTMTVIAVIARDRWRSGGALPAFIPPETDVYWLIAALFIKQNWVLVSAGWPPRTTGLWISLATSILVALSMILIPQRARPWATWGTNALLSLLLCADGVFMRFFHDLPSFAVLGAVEQTGQVVDSILTLFEWSDVWFFADLVPAVFLMPVLRRQTLRPRRRLIVAGVVALLLTGMWAVWSVRGPERGPSVHHRSHLRMAQHLGVLGYHISSAYGLAREALYGVAITEDDWRFVTTVLDERRSRRAGTGDRFGVALGYNLVMIQVESLQGQLLDLEVNGQEVTPALNRLAKEGVSFSLCIDQTSFGRTADAELMSQTSLLPDTKGPALIRHAGNDLIGLADILGERGYSTLVAVPFRESFWNRGYSHPAFGFTTRLYGKDFEPGRKVGWGLNDRDFLQQAAGRLLDLPEPFFAYLITLSNHHPFSGFPEDFEILDLHGIDSGPISGYLHSMRWADEAIGDFLESLNAEGLAPRTVIVVFGDHRAGLRRLSEGSSVVDLGSTTAERILNRRVPVVMWSPSAGAPRGEVDIPIGLVDLPPTIAALLGVDPGDLPWLGRNLFGQPEEGPVTVGNRMWVDGRHIYSEEGSRTCFDRFTGKQVARARCADAAAEANRLRAAGALILNADLQQRLRTYLEAGGVAKTGTGSADPSS